jgi:hypothetical protein
MKRSIAADIPNLPAPKGRIRLVVKQHDLDPKRSVLHVLNGTGQTIERVTSNCVQRLFDFADSVYPNDRVLSAIIKDERRKTYV